MRQRHTAQKSCPLHPSWLERIPSVLDQEKRTPLHLAAEGGKDSVVGILLEHEADPKGGTVRNCWQFGERTPLHLAAEEGHALIVSKLLVGGANKDPRGLDGETPLHLAARNNRLGAVEELLAAGANLETRDRHCPRNTALDMAAKEGHVDVVITLLQHGSRANASDFELRGIDGHTALHCAADGVGPHHDNGDVLRLLLEAGADIEAKTKTVDQVGTPLHVAASNDSSGNKVRSLLEGGANVNARGADGNTETPRCTTLATTPVLVLRSNCCAGGQLTGPGVGVAGW